MKEGFLNFWKKRKEEAEPTLVDDVKEVEQGHMLGELPIDGEKDEKRPDQFREAA